MEDKEQKRKEKVAQAIKDKKIVDDTSFTVFQMVEDLNDRLDNEIPKITEVLEKIKGDKGDSPTEEELLNLIQPLIPEPIVPKDGENYVLTDQDKLEIAQSIKVPVVDKEIRTIIEKTEVVRVEPLVTENVVEKALYEEPNQIVQKINSATELIDSAKIKGFSDLEKISRMNAFNPAMGPSFSDLTGLSKRITTLENAGSGSGTGTPGGSDTQIQFNDGGAFGGAAGFTYNKAATTFTAPTANFTGSVTFTGTSVTAAQGQDRINIGISSGTPKIVFEDNGSARIWSIDMPSGELRFVDETGGVQRFGMTPTLAFMDVAHFNLSASASMYIGNSSTAPTARLHIAAGTASAGTAPFKLTAGTNLGTTEAGAVEYDGSHIYFSPSNGGTRYQLDQQSGSILGTNKQVVFFDGTNSPAGNANFTYDKTTNALKVGSAVIGASAFIGTEKLYVNGNMILPDTSYPNKILMFGTSANSAYITTEASTKGFAFVNAVSGKSGFFTSGAGGVFTFNDTGNSVFGSGTPGTTYLVEVLGNFRTTTSAFFATTSGGVVIGGTTFIGSEVLSVNGNTVLLGGIGMTGAVTIYKNVTTAGWGVPAIYGSGRSTAQTAAVASVATYTVGAADGSFLISANVNVTSSTAHSFTVTCAYTDETNTSRTLTLSFIQIGGGTPIATITNVTGAGPYEGVPNHIRCKASTSITIATTGTFTTVTYNVESSIIQLA